MNRITLAAVVSALGLTLAYPMTSATAQPTKEQGWKQTVGKAKVSLMEAVSTAQAAHSGGKAVWAKLSQTKGKSDWQVFVLVEKQLYEVRVSTGSGEITADEPLGGTGRGEKKAERYQDVNAASVALADAIKNAMAVVPGAKAFSAKFAEEKGVDVYSVWLTDGKKTSQVGIDPSSGAVLSNLEKAGPRGDLLAELKIGMTQATDTAVSTLGGGNVLSADLHTSGGAAYWQVMVLKDKGLQEVRVDPVQGTVLEDKDKGKGNGRGGEKARELSDRVKISFNQAVSTAVAQMPGSKAYFGTLKQEKGNPIYRIDVYEGGVGTRIDIDAISGAVMGKAETDPDATSADNGLGG